MTLISDLKNLIELSEKNMLTEEQVELLIKQKVSRFNKFDNSITDYSKDYVSIGSNNGELSNKQWMHWLIDIISSSPNFDLIMEKLTNPLFCEYEFKAIVGMSVFEEYLEGSECPVSEGTNFKRYYSKPVYIKQKRYWAYSQWYNRTGLNNRPLMDQWIEENK
jgi:hypothetical protein